MASNLLEYCWRRSGVGWEYIEDAVGISDTGRSGGSVEGSNDLLERRRQSTTHSSSLRYRCAAWRGIIELIGSTHKGNSGKPSDPLITSSVLRRPKAGVALRL